MRLLRKIAFPISLVYAAVIHLRHFFYDRGWLRSYSFGIATICVGNLSVGGTGKTPMVEFLIAHLRDSYKLAVLSRGYKRKSKGFLLANPNSTVGDLGDEPFQIYTKFPGITVAVDGDRRRGILELQKKILPDMILLDDAFQHRRVTPKLSILLTTHGQLFVDDWYLPTGNLRDTKGAAKRARILVVTKCPFDLSAREQESIAKKLTPGEDQKVLFSTLSYESPRLDGQPVSWEAFGKETITLVTGIAHPEPLVGYLRNRGLEMEHLKFADHHYFTPKELHHLASKNRILTTEKDYVRLQGKLGNLYYIPVRHEFLGNGKDILLEDLNNML
ncbi:MAG: tetraacyldisaccharide 4'-kinase [Bacteroidota bacterium]